MVGYVTLGTNDLKRAAAFYDALAKELGVSRMMENEKFIAWGKPGTGAGIGTIVATYTTGYVADHYSFEPLLIGASLVPLIAMAALLLLVRNTEATRRGLVTPI